MGDRIDLDAVSRTIREPLQAGVDRSQERDADQPGRRPPPTGRSSSGTASATVNGPAAVRAAPRDKRRSRRGPEIAGEGADVRPGGARHVEDRDRSIRFRVVPGTQVDSEWIVTLALASSTVSPARAMAYARRPPTLIAQYAGGRWEIGPRKPARAASTASPDRGRALRGRELALEVVGRRRRAEADRRAIRLPVAPGGTRRRGSPDPGRAAARRTRTDRASRRVRPASSPPDGGPARRRRARWGRPACRREDAVEARPERRACHVSARGQRRPLAPRRAPRACLGERAASRTHRRPGHARHRRTAR